MRVFDRLRLFGFALTATMGIGAAGCGDVGSVRVELEFPDEETELRTRAILYRAREVPSAGRSGCADLWGGQPGDLRQKESIVEYPNRTDIRALGIDLAPFEELTFFAYAYPSLDVATSLPIAGGCIQTPVSGEETSSVVITLQFPP